MHKTELIQLKTFEGLSDEDLNFLCENVQKMSLPKGATVFQSGQECGAFIFLLHGSVRVHMTGETGREIVLYRVEEGQTCILTTACLLANDDYSADAICEEDSEALVLTASIFNKMIGTSEGFRAKVFENYATRLSSLMGLIEEIAFSKMDQRLAQSLLKQSQMSKVIKTTHYDLAVELGSAREVVSRLLKDFEKKQIILLRRGEVEILDQKALEKIIEC